MIYKKLYIKFGGVSNVKVEGKDLKFDKFDGVRNGRKKTIRMSVPLKEFIN